MLNKTLKNYLDCNLQYKTRENTDTFFPYASKFSYFGAMDDMAVLIQENQLKQVRFWRVFVEQFRGDPDTLTSAWRGEYWGKMMRGACLTYQYTNDADLYKILEDTAKDMLTTQDELGRFSTYSVEGEFRGWDMWARKYVLLGFLHFHEICKDDALKKQIIQSLKRHLDYIIEKIGNGEGQIKITDTSNIWGGINSSSILEPVVRFYNATGEDKYLKFASYIVEEGGASSGNIFEMAYENKLKPYQFPEIKAYEMMSCFEGLLEYYRVTGIEKWKTAAINYAKGIIDTDITIIGCAGCDHEVFDHSGLTQTLSSSRGIMQETCVTVTWMKYLMQLLCLTGDIIYAEEIEKSIYNALYGSINTQKSNNNGGLMFDSYSPLLKYHRGIAIGGLQTLGGVEIYGCCAAIGAAGTAIAPIYTMLLSRNGVVFNSYADGLIDTFTPKDQPLNFELETSYPVEDDVKITLNLENEEEFEIKFRIPAFADGATLTINGQERAVKVGEYASVTRKWQAGDVIELHFDVTLKIIKAPDNPDDENSKNHIALKRGALVLARDARLSYDVGEAFEYDKNIYLKRIDSLNIDSLCQYLVSTDKGFATVMIDYASAGKTMDEKSSTECWLPTEKF